MAPPAFLPPPATMLALLSCASIIPRCLFVLIGMDNDIVLMNSYVSAQEDLQNDVEFGTGGNYDNKSEEEDSSNKSSKEEGLSEEY